MLCCTSCSIKIIKTTNNLSCFFRFSKFGVTSENGHQNKNEDTLSLRQTVNDQRKEIDTLKAQVLSKDLKIRQLEDELIVMRRATNGKLIGENGIHVSESVA